MGSSGGLEMEHPSRPGYHGAPLSAEGGAAMALVAETMIPSAEGWPASGELVSHFVSGRISAAEREGLEPLLAELAGEADPEDWLRRVEEERPERFAELRAWVYYGYYGSGSVIDVLDARYGYHGAPQPLGYRIDREPRLPAKPRGSYRRTEEVVRVVG
jgi:hypothetical protein